ncbi:MAG: sulfurtransferase TusA family protein [Myxococcaceae bacterium]|jgi:tRNA 2-thiouridine synthesizing protein A|nr:sulfurtransferase TusA family protein [Myxococcaceae bacterium]MCA3016677.1 sulfurtransferase TusA family protein [Myxococcaceae bacterium]
MFRASIDITREVCPMTWVRVKLKLEELSPGDRLEVRLRGDEPRRNLPRNAASEGHRVEAMTEHDDGSASLVIEVGAGP